MNKLNQEGNDALFKDQLISEIRQVLERLTVLLKQIYVIRGALSNEYKTCENLAQRIANYFPTYLSANVDYWVEASDFIIGFIDAICHRLNESRSIGLATKELQSIIANLKEKLQANKPRSNPYQVTEEQLQKEKSRYEEQCRLDKDPQFKNILNSIKEIAPLRGRKVEKFFISYAWPEKDIHHEAYTKDFVHKLRDHLEWSGLHVFLDQDDSSCGELLMNFMRDSINQADHVIVICDRTMRFKFEEKGKTGVEVEYLHILNRWKKDNPKRFVIPLCLNEGSFRPGLIGLAAEVSIYEENYLEVLKELIRISYGFSKEEFAQLWSEQSIKSTIQPTVESMPHLLSLQPSAALTPPEFNAKAVDQNVPSSITFDKKDEHAPAKITTKPPSIAELQPHMIFSPPPVTTTLPSTIKYRQRISLFEFAKLIEGAYSKTLDITVYDWKRIASTNENNLNYFGAAFLNASTRQLVIVHLGVSPSKLHDPTSNMLFVKPIMEAYKEAKLFTQNMQNLYGQLVDEVSETGFGVGAVFAQLNAIEFSRTTPTVTFECTGVKSYLTEQQLARLQNVNIVNVLSAPNFMNCANGQVGELIRIYIPHVMTGKSTTTYNDHFCQAYLQYLSMIHSDYTEFCKDLKLEVFQYFDIMHSISNILQTFQPGQGPLPYLCSKMQDWPSRVDYMKSKFWTYISHPADEDSIDFTSLGNFFLMGVNLLDNTYRAFGHQPTAYTQNKTVIANRQLESSLSKYIRGYREPDIDSFLLPRGAGYEYYAKAYKQFCLFFEEDICKHFAVKINQANLMQESTASQSALT